MRRGALPPKTPILYTDEARNAIAIVLLPKGIPNILSSYYFRMTEEFLLRSEQEVRIQFPHCKEGKALRFL